MLLSRALRLLFKIPLDRSPCLCSLYLCSTTVSHRDVESLRWLWLASWLSWLVQFDSDLQSLEDSLDDLRDEKDELQDQMEDAEEQYKREAVAFNASLSEVSTHR